MEHPNEQRPRGGTWRALALSIAALAVPVAGAFWFPESMADYEALLWLLALIPAFLLANDRGWGGIATALAAGMAVLSLTYATAQSFGQGVPPLLFVVVPVYLVIALGAGWLAERVAVATAGRGPDAVRLTDPLTGLATHEHADFFVQREFVLTETDRPLVAVLFEFDQFERFVGQHGRPAGDGALRAFATILRQMTRRTNLSARYGRAEFLSVLVSSTEEGAVIYAQRVRERLRSAEAVTPLPSVSIGIACYQPSMSTPAELVAAAREALRRAQRDGGDRLRVDGRTADPGVRAAEREPTAEADAGPETPTRPVLVPLTGDATPPGSGRSAFVFCTDAPRGAAVAERLRADGFRVATGASHADRIRPIATEFDLVVTGVAPDRATVDMVQEIRSRHPATRLVGLPPEPGDAVPAWVFDLRLDGHLSGTTSSTMHPPVPELMAERDRIRASTRQTRELTDEVRAKEREARIAIAESEARYRSVVESIREVVFRTDATGCWTFLNAAWASITGFDPAACLGQSAFDYLEPDGPLLRKEFERLLAGRQPYLQRELRCRTRDGSCRWVEARAQLEWDAPSGEPGTFGTLSDVTERREAEQALRRSEEYFRSLIEQSADIMAVLSADARIRYVSPAMERVLGYASDDRIGRDGLEHVHPDDVARSRMLLAAVLAEPGGTAETELRALAADGTWRQLEVSVRNLTHLPSVDGLVINARDVTERRTTERALRESEELLAHAQKMDAIGRLAGGVAHDFNNLLTAIKGHTELLLADLPADAPIRDDLNEIGDAATRATGLTRQLLAFSRKQVLQPKVLDLNGVVHDLQRMLVRLIGADIELDTALAEGLAPIRADRTQIEQVILNLVVNARDAMPDGGRLTIRTAPLDTPSPGLPAEVPAGHWIALRVSDTGIGMDAGTLAQAFEPFFTTKEHGRGTGLGLSTVYGVVKQSGGFVWGESDTRSGTSVTILLPAIAALPAAVEPPRERTARPLEGRETVALVEDEKSVRDLSERILSRRGYRVLVAEDGPRGLAMIDAHDGPIDLLVTDVVMPGMGGRELAERVRRLRPDVRVLYMSGYAEDAVLREGALEAGSGFLEKPFSPDALLSRVRELLDARAGSAPRPAPAAT